MKVINVSDISLKGSNRAETLSLSFKEKLELAKRLCELNVDVIELGPVALDKAEEVLIKTISTCVNKTVSCSVGNSIESVEKNFQLISGAKNKRLSVSVPVSPVQMEYFVSKKPSAVIELLKALTEKAVSLCQEVEVSLEDATRAEPAFLYTVIKTAIEAGAKIISINDIAGRMMPFEFSEFLHKVYANVPELNNVKLAVMCSNMFAMGVANTLSAISSGAYEIKISALSGNSLAPVEAISNALDVIGGKMGYTCNLEKTGLHRVLGRINAIANSKGEFSAFETNSAEKTEGLGNNLTKASLNKIIKKLGYELSLEDYEKVYEEVMRLTDKKEVNTKELDLIIATTALQVKETYQLESFSVHSSNVLTSTASLVINKNGEKLSGISFGNGSIDASFLAIENATGKHFELDDFQVFAVTEGKEAMAETIVKLRFDGKIYSGRGLSTDIVGAGIRAYLSALNKIVYEEEVK